MWLLKSASSLSLSNLENGRCLPFTSHMGSEEPAFDKGPPRKSRFRPCHAPIPWLWSGTSVVAAPTSCIFHLPSPPPLPSTPIPTINENQKEGEVGTWKSNSFLIYRSPPEDQGQGVWSLPWSEEQSSHRGQGPGWARPVTPSALISPAVQLGKSWATMKTRCYIRSEVSWANKLNNK